MKIDIQAQLRSLRIANRFTQSYVAGAIGIQDKAYQKYEEGRANPNIQTLLALSDFYLITLDELLGRKAGMNQSALVERYRGLSVEKRRIVDFILGG